MQSYVTRGCSRGIQLTVHQQRTWVRIRGVVEWINVDVAFSVARPKP
jgi:hypothetical protein